MICIFNNNKKLCIFTLYIYCIFTVYLLYIYSCIFNNNKKFFVAENEIESRFEDQIENNIEQPAEGSKEIL